MEREVQALFDEMYTLTLTPDTETRTRTVTKTGTHTVTDPVTGEETEEEYEYEEEEEYEVSILRVVLTVKPLETIVAGKMDAEQTEIFAMYAETGGLYSSLLLRLICTGITIFQAIMDTARTRIPEMRNCTGVWI